ncbi:major facilitator superfamily MFS_1 [Paenibacillus curdlanolyticus YK9]|uniref:Major facilitator superfamily MFS_1 n=1 Tax=Paenibacillus curdlanolyticus YK9 TaxID=717606 RepID=E0ICZ8_9BACL|nr:MFS transporter [Paenibacillus curdlanolyticus]EFM09453.1 major facilitator superfamily MFS_1 [Paenibacillus curdlanolyticus YK9]
MSSTWKIYILTLISFLVGTSEYVIAGILDQIAASLSISLVAAGQLITVFSIVYAFGTPLLIALTARWDRRKLLLSGLGLFVLANGLVFALPGFTLFLVARIIMALGAGIVVVTALTVASSIAPQNKQGSAIATVIMGFTASLIIGVPIGRIVAAHFDWKIIFAGIVLLGLVAIIVLWATIPHTQNAAPIPLRQQLAILRSRTIILALAISFFWLAGYSIAYTYISPFLLDVTGMNEQTLSAALLAFGIASLIGSKLGGYGTDRWGVQRTLVSGMVLHVIALLLLSTAIHSPIIVFAALMLWSFAAWSSGPTQQYNLVTLAPESASIMLSLNSSVMQLAMAAGAGIGGIVVGSVSLRAVMWMGAIGVALAIGIIALLARYARSNCPERHNAEAEELQQA